MHDRRGCGHPARCRWKGCAGASHGGHAGPPRKFRFPHDSVCHGWGFAQMLAEKRHVAYTPVKKQKREIRGGRFCVEKHTERAQNSQKTGPLYVRMQSHKKLVFTIYLYHSQNTGIAARGKCAPLALILPTSIGMIAVGH